VPRKRRVEPAGNLTYREDRAGAQTAPRVSDRIPQASFVTGVDLRHDRRAPGATWSDTVFDSPVPLRRPHARPARPDQRGGTTEQRLPARGPARGAREGFVFSLTSAVFISPQPRSMTRGSTRIKSPATCESRRPAPGSSVVEA
jgi:hypothetical protein